MQELPTFDPRTRTGAVTLTVNDLERLAGFYGEAVGLATLALDARVAVLGTPGGEPLLVLREDRDAAPAPSSAAGLYHTAFLLPTRRDLAMWVSHAAQLNLRVGAGDHLVSEAFYLSDPEGNGIEVYADRPRETWRVTGTQVAMDTLPVNVPDLLRELDAAPGAWDGAPDGSTVGHVHLRVNDLGQSRAFYEGVIGLDVVNDAYPGALFVSAGGYHHHLGMNVWHTRDGNPAPAGSRGLSRYTLLVPGEEQERQVAERLRAARYEASESPLGIVTRDPSGNRLLLSGRRPDAAAWLAL